MRLLSGRPKNAEAGAGIRGLGSEFPCSHPPVTFTACAAARGFARHGTPEGDALLIWYRSHGTERIREVEMYLARRVISAGWDFPAEEAARIIRAAMVHVRAGRTSALRTPRGIRKARYQEHRAQASAWLRAGIMEANWRYGLARG